MFNGKPRAGNSREFPVSRETGGKFLDLGNSRVSGISRGSGISRISGNSRTTGNSREGNFPGLTGGREWEFPIEHHWWEATLLSSVVTDAAPERNAGASGSLHAEPNTLVGPDT